MKLTVEEGNYIQGLVAQARNLYGKNWERILKKTALALPEKGLNTRTGVLEEFDAQKEEKVIKKASAERYTGDTSGKVRYPEAGKFPGQIRRLERQVHRSKA